MGTVRVKARRHTLPSTIPSQGKYCEGNDGRGKVRQPIVRMLRRILFNKVVRIWENLKFRTTHFSSTWQSSCNNIPSSGATVFDSERPGGVFTAAHLPHFDTIDTHACFIVDYLELETKLDIGPLDSFTKHIDAMGSLIPFLDTKRCKSGT